MQGLRAQIDRDQYRSNMQAEMQRTEGLSIREDSVEDIIFENGDSDDSTPRVKAVCLGVCCHDSTFL